MKALIFGATGLVGGQLLNLLLRDERYQLITSLNRKNLARSPIYAGVIDSVGPRYCPSIEDKVVRFSDKTSHKVVLEPEELKSNSFYPNGISTSLPIDVQ